MGIVRVLGCAAFSAALCGLAMAGETDGKGPREGGPRKGAGGPRCEAGASCPGMGQGERPGGPGGHGAGFGLQALMEKADVKAEVEKHRETLKALHEQMKEVRESTRKGVQGAADEAAKTVALDTAKAKLADLFGKIIDERIRHQEAMTKFMKTYRDELVAAMQAKMGERAEEMKERRGEKREERRGEMKDRRGKGGKGGPAGEAEDAVF